MKFLIEFFMVVYGKQVFWYIFEKHPELIEEILLAKEIDKKEFSKIAALGKKIVRLDEKKAQALSKGKTHQGYFASIRPIEPRSFEDLKRCEFLVVLVGVTDVGNIGSIMRSAYALGVDGIVLTQIRDLPIEGAMKSSSGALADIPYCVVPNILDAIHELHQAGFSLLAADSSGEDAKRYDTNVKRALLLGSEGEGIPEKALRKVDKRVGISMRHGFDSLNVANAAAILIDRIR